MVDLPYNPQKLKVLVVDDHELIRKSIIKVLNKMRFEQCFESFSAIEAIKVLQAERIDLILCDIYLQNTNGFEILDYVRNRDTHFDIPFIVVTGEASKDDIVKAADLGAKDYILKPFQATDLEKKVSQILTKYHSPTPLVALIREAEKLLLDNDFVTARLQIEEALKIDPQSAQAAHLSALIHEKCGDVGSAISVLKDCIQTNPSYLKNYRTLANLYLRHDNVQEAVRAMRRELELNPKQPERQVQLAKLLQKSGNYLAAVEHYRAALLEDGKHKIALYGMGKVQADLGNLDKAIYYFKRLRRHHPRNTRALEAIVQSALAANNPRLAEMTLKDEKKQFPKRLDTHIVLAKLYAATERIEDGLVVVQEALAVDKEFLEGFKVKGALEQKLGQLDEALESYKQAVNIKADVDSYIRIAEILIEKNAHLEATHVLHQALRSGQHTAQILTILNYATFKSQQFAKSYLLCMRLAQLKAGTPQLSEIAKKSKEQSLARRASPLNLAS